MLNGNGVTGSASNASYLLGQRGYPILTPPNGIPANAPDRSTTSAPTIYFDAKQKGAKEAGDEGRGPVRLGRRAEGDAGDHARSRTTPC